MLVEADSRGDDSLDGFVGLILYGLIAWTAGTFYYAKKLPPSTTAIAFAVTIVISILGVWAAGVVEKSSLKQDPQFVIIDEVSGQMLALSAAFAPLNWKYLLLGFILFRVFDITKPFPARQAESLPGGWGIMADDWVAALFAAALLWIARGFGM